MVSARTNYLLIVLKNTRAFFLGTSERLYMAFSNKKAKIQPFFSFT